VDGGRKKKLKKRLCSQDEESSNAQRSKSDLVLYQRMEGVSSGSWSVCVCVGGGEQGGLGTCRGPGTCSRLHCLGNKQASCRKLACCRPALTHSTHTGAAPPALGSTLHIGSSSRSTCLPLQQRAMIAARLHDGGSCHA
jgi:hypothetical protein